MKKYILGSMKYDNNHDVDVLSLFSSIPIFQCVAILIMQK